MSWLKKDIQVITTRPIEVRHDALAGVEVTTIPAGCPGQVVGVGSAGATVAFYDFDGLEVPVDEENLKSYAGLGHVYTHPASKYIDNLPRYSVSCTCGWHERPQTRKQNFCGGCGVRLVDGTYRSGLMID